MIMGVFCYGDIFTNTWNMTFTMICPLLKRAYFPSVTFCFSGPKYYSNVYYQSNCTKPKRKTKPDVIYAISNGPFTIGYCMIGWTEVCVREKSVFLLMKE